MKIVITCLLCCWFSWSSNAQEVPGHTKALVGVPAVVAVDTTKEPIRIICLEKLSEKPLVMIDAVVVPWENMQQLDPTSIKGIKIIQPRKAARLYGEKGKYGVVRIKMKKGFTPDEE